MTVKAKRIPAWFKLADYAVAANFNRSDWLVMLSHRHLWRETLDFRYPKGVAEEEKDRFWEAYLFDVLPSNIRVNREVPLRPGWDHEGLVTLPRYISDITEECSKGLARTARALKLEREFFDIRVLTVNVGATDTVLKKDFENWLKEQRKRSPLPAKRRGKRSVNF